MVQEQDLLIRDWWLPEPFLAAVVQLAPHRSQIVVAREHGASVANVTLHGIVRGKLVPLHFRPRHYQDELSLFGTVGTGLANVICAPGGPLILLINGPTSANGKRWFVTRATYQFHRDQFSRVRTRTVKSTLKEMYARGHRWGMDAPPFTRCATARGRHL